MMVRWNDSGYPFGLFDELHREMAGRFETLEDEPAYATGGCGCAPRASLVERGDDFVLTAEIPGLTEKDVALTVTADGVRLEGERKTAAPEGFRPLRQERPNFHFARSYTLPARVDAEHATAALRDGVLTVTLPKAPETKPRQIEVRAS